MYLISLTANESEILEDYVKSCPVPTIRLRAHALLMRGQRLSLEAISKLVFRSVGSITRWFVEFDKTRLASIFSGQIDNENASKLTRVQKLQIKKVLSKPPDKFGVPKEFWDVPKLKNYIEANFDVVYESDMSYHFLLKFSGLSFKYPDKTSPRRDEIFIKNRIKEIKKEIKPLLKSKDWVVLASDEVRVQLEAEIRRAWLVRNKKTKIKTERSKEHQNYIGFLDQKTFKCQVFDIKRGNQIETIRVLKTLMGQYINKKVCVVWDNAKWHKGKLLRQQLGTGKKLQNLHLINLPPYAPEHNPIEHVWKYTKDKISNRKTNNFEEIKQNFTGTISSKIFSYKI